MAIGNVVGKGFLVEDTGAQHHTRLPGCKIATHSWDVSINLADADALLFGLKLVLEYDERLVPTAIRAGNLRQGWIKR